MASMSDVIEVFLKELLEQSRGKPVEIQRNEVAKYFDCSPSQINYVLMTRFSVQHGYYIESQRGGGGYIKITMLREDKNQPLYRVMLKEIRDSLTKSEAVRIIKALQEKNMISEREAAMMRAATDDSALASPLKNKDLLRARILRAMIAAVFR